MWFEWWSDLFLTRKCVYAHRKYNSPTKAWVICIFKPLLKSVYVKSNFQQSMQDENGS